jgi:hypothetical protein
MKRAWGGGLFWVCEVRAVFWSCSADGVVLRLEATLVIEGVLADTQLAASYAATLPGR